MSARGDVLVLWKQYSPPFARSAAPRSGEGDRAKSALGHGRARHNLVRRV